MNVTKINPVGLDAQLQRLQTILWARLTLAWGLPVNTKAYEAYGRIYRNLRDSGYVAETYTANGEYKEVFWNDELSAISFIGVAQKLEKGKPSNAHFVLFANLAKLYPLVPHRADEELRQTVIDALGGICAGFKLVSVETGVDKVLAEYTASKNRLAKSVDMHPVVSLRFNLSFMYNPNKC